jgi:hypothetical protein
MWNTPFETNHDKLFCKIYNELIFEISDYSIGIYFKGE